MKVKLSDSATDWILPRSKIINSHNRLPPRYNTLTCLLSQHTETRQSLPHDTEGGETDDREDRDDDRIGEAGN